MARTGIAPLLSCCRKYVRFKQPFQISGIIWEKIRPQSCNRSERAQDRGCRTAVIPTDRYCTGFNRFGAKTHNSGKLDAIRAVEGVKRVFVERTYEPQRAEKEEMLPQMITSSATVWQAVRRRKRSLRLRMSPRDSGTMTQSSGPVQTALPWELTRHTLRRMTPSPVGKWSRSLHGSPN